jgi:hypothetical protein
MDPRQQLLEERQREADRLALERDQAARHDAGMRAPAMSMGSIRSTGSRWCSSRGAATRMGGRGVPRLSAPAKRRGGKAS